MKEIPISKGLITLVDDADFEWLSKYKWYAVTPRDITYAYAAIRQPDGIVKNVRMHRLIMKAGAGQQIDHIDRNALNNQKHNLRFCTPSQNLFNRRWNKKGHTSQYKGVYRHTQNPSWIASININGRQTNLGSFKNEQDAAKAYDAAARLYAGEFATLNFPCASDLDKV